jgi:hypothetical protein
MKMSNEAKTLIEQARALPPQDRIALVEDVLDSLDLADPISTNCGRGRRATAWRPTAAGSLRPKTCATLSPNTGRDGPVS